MRRLFILVPVLVFTAGCFPTENSPGQTMSELFLKTLREGDTARAYTYLDDAYKARLSEAEFKKFAEQHGFAKYDSLGMAGYSIYEDKGETGGYFKSDSADADLKVTLTITKVKEVWKVSGIKTEVQKKPKPAAAPEAEKVEFESKVE